MLLDDLIKNCEFDFSKASKKIKTTILTLSTLMIATNAMSATKNTPSDAFLYEEQSSYSQSIELGVHASSIDTMNYMLKRTAPDKEGEQYLDSMESMGVVSTPILYAEYMDLANPDEGSAKVDVFRNPLSKDGIVLMATSETVKRNSTFESLFSADQYDLDKYEGKAIQGLVEEENEWHAQSVGKEKISELTSEAIEKINRVVGGLDNDNIKEKFGFRARKDMGGGFGVRNFDVIKPAIYGLESGRAKNPGGKYYFDDGNARVNISSLYSGGSKALNSSMAIEAMRDTAFLASDISSEAKDLMTRDFFPIDREIIGELSQEDKVAIANAQTLIHETYHGVISYSTNSAQPSLMFNAFNQAYQSGHSYHSDLIIGNVKIFDMGAYRLNHESTSDMAAMTIAASGADKASWELTKLIQQSIRKQSYLDGMIHAPTKDANFEMDIGKISSSVANNPNAATNLFQNHDVSFLVNGWVLALEDARNGDDPNNLLALASEPVKMAMAIQFANAVVLGELKQTTNNWQSLPKAQYAAFVDKGSELMHDYVKSDEFKSVMSAINTKEHEPKLTVSLDMSSDYEEPKSKSQMKL